MGAVSALALAAAVAAPSQVAAQTAVADAGSLDPIIVVGTRRSDMTALTSATPVQVVTGATLSDASIGNLSKALQFEAPSFHFPQDNPSTSVQYAVKGASLHGLGPDEVLVLIDGIRYHLNSQVNTGYLGYGRGTQVVDIDTIPVAAIDRTEILTDGASAQYGSDAIAGVINIILKNQNHGEDLNAQYGGYTRGGGQTGDLSGSLGFTLPNNGFFHVALEGVYTEPVKAQEAPDTRAFYFAGNPLESTANRYWFYGNGQYDKFGLMANGEEPLANNLTAYTLVEAGTRQNYGFGNFRRPDDDGTIRALYPNGFEPQQKVTSLDYDVAVGLRYQTDQLGKINLSLEHGSNRASIYVWNTDNASLGLASGTGGYGGATVADETNLNLDYNKPFTLGFMASPLNLAAGLAYRNERYEIDAGDPFTWINGGQPILDGPDKGNPAALGSQSASGFQPADAGVFSRDVYGGYVDLEGKVLPKLDLGVAGRFEHYSDFGWTDNGKISARYEFIPAIALRASVSTGYRAPSMGQIDYAHTTGIFVNNVQYLQRILPADSAAAEALGAKPLTPEESTNYSAGVVLKGFGNTSLTIDGYDIVLNHRIVLSASLTGSLVSSILTKAGFPGLQGAQFFTNAVDTRTEGVDIVAHKSFNFGDSKLGLSAALNVNSTVITHVDPNPPQLSALSIQVVDRQQKGFIERDTPDSKLVLGADYSWKGFTISPSITRYGTYAYLDASKPANDQTFGAQWVTDLTVAYKINPILKLTVGADNLFNTFPNTQIPAERNPNVSIYSTLSPDGAYGTFLFVRLTASL
jgi:iron complex outermembrane receptor protein